MAASPVEIVEYRGVEGLVAAEILCDDNSTEEGHGYVTGEVFSIAGVAEISKASDDSNEAHYYDNIPAIIVANESSDTITCSVSAIPLDVLAKLTGQYYDQSLGALVEGSRKQKYFAVGYKARKTSGDEVFVWRLKASCNTPAVTNTTENAGTDANGQELIFTGIRTTHKFTKTHEGAKSLIVDCGLDLADVSEFFDTVTTPDTLQAKTVVYNYNTVSYDANGGTGTIDSVDVLEGSSIGLDDGSGLTPPSSKVFAGWATTSGATAANVSSPYTPTADVTLYAVWTDET